MLSAVLVVGLVFAAPPVARAVHDGPEPAGLPITPAEIAAGAGTDQALDVTGWFVPGAGGATYLASNPIRLLDTRTGNGLAGTFDHAVPRTVQVAGRGGVPSNAVAVTVNLTVTGQTTAGYIALGPTVTANPTTSTLNFPLGDNRANGLTIGLGPGGTLAAVFRGTAGAKTHLVLDVTGWFVPSAAGSSYVPSNPVRLLDTRTGNGLSGAFVSRTPRSFQVTGRGGVPANAVAVTVNLTVTGQTSAGYVSLGPTMTSNPSTSTINFPVGDNRANGVTVALSAGGALAAVFRGASSARTHLVLDVTGWFVPGTSGATYVPAEPTRVLDTRSRTGLSGMFASSLPRSFQVTGHGIPSSAVAVTVNLTVTNQTSAGYVSLGPTMGANPSTSTLNFPLGDDRANGVTVALGPGGTLEAVFKGRPGPNYPSYDSLYHNEWEMLLTIRATEIAYPDIVQVFTIGRSHQGRPIWAAKISDNVAVDEPEPEVLFDALTHAREHLTVEQALDLLHVLTAQYGTNTQVRDLVDTREIFIIFAVNPDGWAYDLTPTGYKGWRKNRQPTPGSTAIGTDPNRNYDYRWGCCGGSSSNPAAWNYRGPAPWSAPEVRALRDFINSRVVDSRQQIRTHVTLHTNGELILYPYGYTKTDIPADMTVDDHATFVAMAQAMAATNGYRPQQSSDLYVTDGDMIDWTYGRHGIFSFTFELYPPDSVAKSNDHEPPDEVIAAETARNRAALLYLIGMANCPQAAIGKAHVYC